MVWEGDILSQISLLPLEYKNYILKEKKKRIYILAGIVIASAFTIFTIMIMLLNLIYLNQLNSLNIEKQQLEAIIETYGKYSDVYNSVKRQEEIIQQANINRYDWDEVLELFSNTVHPGMWFNNIELNYDGEKGICTINGQANDFSSVAQWIKDIENQKILKSVNCQYLQGINSTDAENIEFEVIAEIDMEYIKSNG